MSRIDDIVRFYELLDRLETCVGGKRTLAEASSQDGWSARGVYFFFEPGEHRSGRGAGPRVVRVGTHALKAGSRRLLWQRLSQHRGTIRSGGGNHRGSIFRLLVGDAIKNKGAADEPQSWGVAPDPGQAARKLGTDRRQLLDSELPLEREVSDHIRAMHFLSLPVEDEPGPESLRGVIERNSVALLSNYGRQPVDAPSAAWLGLWSSRERVRKSGLWNNRHVEESYDPSFLDELEARVPESDQSAR